VVSCCSVRAGGEGAPWPQQYGGVAIMHVQERRCPGGTMLVLLCSWLLHLT
jgi:hypothetical protein